MHHSLPFIKNNNVPLFYDFFLNFNCLFNSGFMIEAGQTTAIDVFWTNNLY